MNVYRIIRLRGIEHLARRTADYIVAAARRAVRDRGRFSLVLAGGASIMPAYRLLTQLPWLARMPWPATDLFFGDERWVPVDHEHSNFGAIRRVLPGGLPPGISPRSVVPLVAEEELTAQAAAEVCEMRLRAMFAAPPQATRPSTAYDVLPASTSRGQAGGTGTNTGTPPPWPTFDLVLLGVGPDGHTASLFPGMHILDEKRRWVVATPRSERDPKVERLTLTFPAINHARRVLLVIAGQGKEPVVEALYANQSGQSAPNLPVTRIRAAEATRVFTDVRRRRP